MAPAQEIPSSDEVVDVIPVDAAAVVGAIALEPEITAAEELPVLLRRHEIARLRGLTLSETKRATDALQTERPEFFEHGHNDDDSQVVYMLSTGLEQLPAGDGWVTDEGLAKELKVSIGTVQRSINKLREDFADCFRLARGPEDFVPREHVGREISDRIRAIFGERRERRQKRKETERLTDDFEAFTEEMKAGESLDAQEFEMLFTLFGTESGFDVLYQFKPEYKNKIPMPLVKSFLADYLGEFILKPGELNLDQIDKSLPYLTNKNLQQALTEVIKRHCLKNYHQQIRQNRNQDDFDIIADYLDSIKLRIEGFDSEQLDAVLEEVEAYYLSLFEIEVPDMFVDGLVDGRPFPDLNQRINIKETALNKRMLIADEPGMGKSASAILTKEIVGSKCAVIVAPSQVLKDDVWQNYLSSRVDENGRQIGYFKAGREPRVLEVSSVQQLWEASAEDYDYVLISQERINEDYCQALRSFNYDMLIVDEAHNFKNITEGKRSQEMIQLADKLNPTADHLMLLTATPAPNKVIDIAFALRLLYPGKFDQYSNQDLVHRLIHGDVLDIRSLLLPRMQVKRLGDSLDMPPKHEMIVDVELTQAEKEAYEILLEEWEIDPRDKIRLFRQMLMNPAILDATPNINSAKIHAVGSDLGAIFQTKDKVLMFVNDYVNGVISGPQTIIPTLKKYLPQDVNVRVIFGDIADVERRRIQQSFQTSSDKELLIVSGQTMHLGVDLSAAEELLFYNEPWTETQRRQEIGRGWRPGRTGELVVRSYITRGTLEEGIHQYIKFKYGAIEKLIYGVPLTDIEKELLDRAEAGDEQSLAVNAELAAHYFSSIDRMNKIFSRVKQIGEDKLTEFLKVNGQEYASTYRQLTSRSYQANASRLAGTMIHKFIEKGAGDEDANPNPVILDLGSGPEMLRRHIPDELAANVISLDINTQHFSDGQGIRTAGTLARLPVADKSVDFANLSLVLHYTAWAPSHGRIERFKVLKELNRTLKPHGRAVIVMPYSLDVRDEATFAAAVSRLGFMVVEEFSGLVQTEGHFKGRVITLEKIADCEESWEELTEGTDLATQEEATRNLKDGLAMKDTSKVTVRDSRKIATNYSIKDQTVIDTVFNQVDQRILEEEQAVLREMKFLRDSYEKIELIPAEEIVDRGYARIHNGNGYILFKHLETGDGAVILRNF